MHVVGGYLLSRRDVVVAVEYGYQVSVCVSGDCIAEDTAAGFT